MQVGIFFKYTDEKAEMAGILAEILVEDQRGETPFFFNGARAVTQAALLYFYYQGYSFIDAITAMQTTRTGKLLEILAECEDFQISGIVTPYYDNKLETLAGIHGELGGRFRLFIFCL